MRSLPSAETENQLDEKGLIGRDIYFQLFLLSPHLVWSRSESSPGEQKSHLLV